MSCYNIYTLSALSFLQAYRNEDYLATIKRADMILADGVGAVWGYKFLAGQLVERIPGIDFIEELCKLCVSNNRSLYCLGGRPEILEGTVKNLQAKFPGLKIAGSHHGYWSKSQESDMIEIINQSGATVLLCALGQPRQEFFLDRYKAKLNVTVAIGVGGSFDVLAGKLKRAPKWLQQMGLEWLVRVFQEPNRLIRILKLPLFVWLVWRAKIRG